MAEDFGGKPWSWIHHMAVVTAAAVNKPETILFWHEHEPSGHWWEASKPYLTLQKIAAPREIFGRPLLHPAHQADVVRLRSVLEHGGVYVDADVWCLRPFAELDHCGFWMGRQQDAYGLCNATFGGEPGAAFAEAWLAEYSWFRSQGRDRYWDEHSVRLPLRLAESHPITVFPPTWFFAPLWGDLPQIFSRRQAERNWLRDSYSVHLWETITWPHLKRLGPTTIDRQSEIGKRLDALGVL